MRPRRVAPLPRSEARPMQSIAVGRAHFDRTERDLQIAFQSDCGAIEFLPQIRIDADPDTSANLPEFGSCDARASF
jgi:hypothetical protein